MQQPKPLALTDDDITAILTIGAPLRPADQDAFLALVYAELSKCSEVGPGRLHIILRNAQKRFLRPPLGVEVSGHHAGKYAKG